MSASNKKKLRKEQAADVLTAKQAQEQAEAKKLKAYTITFLAAMIIVVVTAIGVLGVRAVNNSGIIQKSTIAAHIGDRKLNTVELSYYYIDAINSFYNEWKSYYSDNTDTYLQAMGLDTTKPLNKQVYDEKTGKTWAEHFVEQAISQAASDYAMYDLAKAENFVMSEDQQKDYDSAISMIELYSSIYGYSNADQYLRAAYGYGSELDTYKTYFERSSIASAYYAAYRDKFSYTDDQRNEYAADKEANYNSYTFDSVYLSYTYFREGGTKDDKGNTTYTEAENEAARKKMKEVADQLATASSVTDLKEKVAAVKVSEGSSISVTENKNTLYTSIGADVAKWLSDKDRKDGDIVAIPNESTTTDADGKEVKTTNGYYVVIFHSSTDNKTAMADMGYIYVPYEGGTKNDAGETVYSDEDKANTRTKVEDYLKQWQEGEKTEASLEELAGKLIDEEKAKSGGLVENLNPDSDFDSAIMDWALNTARVEGETTIIEADDGFYLLYYSKKAELNYRHYMIDNEMRDADYAKWYEGVISAIETSVGNTSKMDLDLTLS